MSQHSDFINLLGKPQEVADKVSAESGKTIGRESVYKWRKHGVPWRWQPFVAKLAIQKGVKHPEDLQVILNGSTGSSKGKKPGKK